MQPSVMQNLTRTLTHFTQHYAASIPELATIANQLEQLAVTGIASAPALVKLYEDALTLLEPVLWQEDTHFHAHLDLYQQLFREQQALIDQTEEIPQYDFLLSIPIADRPEHLRGCLESIWQLCQHYHYGGWQQGRFSKIAVLVVEDSQDPRHVALNRQLAGQYTAQGLNVYHYDLPEQASLLQKVPANLQPAVRSIMGEYSPTQPFYHKGQAVTRNLSHLKFLQLEAQKPTCKQNRTLYYFVDSDQQFRVNRSTPQGDEYVYALNYFYYINKLFHRHDLLVLTGKLVCDPPVSPSVMAANFLDDIATFITQLTSLPARQSCQFHPTHKQKPSDAAYHDMAQLFGLGVTRQNYDYCCPLPGLHDHKACLKQLAERINYFFFGEHLTRKTYFNYQGDFTALQPARTIYPGNHICTRQGLRYIIPFGTLRLRMSGPTAGRLIQAEIGPRFASANLPMLHARTLQTDFTDEFRPGVCEQNQVIDLSDEFERQFFGDLMLFSVERLTKTGNPKNDFSPEQIQQTLTDTLQTLLPLYQQKQQRVIQQAERLEQLLQNATAWWHQEPELADALQLLQQFLNSIRHNFSEHSKANQQIFSHNHQQHRQQQIHKALLHYGHDRAAWDALLNQYTG